MRSLFFFTFYGSELRLLKKNPIINTCFSLLLSMGIQEKLNKMEYCRTIKLHLYCGLSTISLAVRINDPASSITAFPKSGWMETGRELGGCQDNQTNRCILATGIGSQNTSITVPQNQPNSHRHEFILSTHKPVFHWVECNLRCLDYFKKTEDWAAISPCCNVLVYFLK